VVAKLIQIFGALDPARFLATTEKAAVQAELAAAARGRGP
jgi:hypothetical protein